MAEQRFVEARRGHASRLLTLVTVVVIVAVLYVARSFLIPVAVAVVLAFVLSPVVSRLERWGMGRLLAVSVTTSASLVFVAATTWIVAVQAISLAADLPTYRMSIRSKLHMLMQQTDSWTGRAMEGLEVVRSEVLQATGGTETPPEVAGGLPERVSPPSVDGAHDLSSLPESLPVAGLPALGEGLLAAVIVVVFTTFALLKREDLRDRIIALAGAEQINVTTRVVDDAAQRVSRFLFAQLLVNVAFGAVIAAGLHVIGVPNALLFGALVVPLRFVPVIGLWIAAGIPTLVAAITLEGWTAPLLALGLFAVVEVIAAYVVEPWAFAARTGISSAAILVSLVFWTWLWGPAGLVLAMPLTVCLAAIGRHLPRHGWLTILLDERPALPAPARVYQRLLALDAEEAQTVAQGALASSGLQQVFDDVLVPALVMLEADRHRGAVPAEQVEFIRSALRDIIETLVLEQQNSSPSSAVDARGGATADGAGGATAGIGGDDAIGEATGLPVLCLPARSESDELVALMLGHLLRIRGRHVEVVPAGTLLNERIEAARRSERGVVCISALPPGAEAQVRVLCGRLRQEIPGARLVAGLWGPHASDDEGLRVKRAGAEIVARSLVDAVRAIAGEARAS